VITLPFHVPVVTVPKLVIFPCTAVGKVELIDGTPAGLVINTPSLPVTIDDNVFAAVVYSIVFAPPKVVTPVPPFATGNVPVIFVVRSTSFAVNTCPAKVR
jgi:hypothetical protein